MPASLIVIPYTILEISKFLGQLPVDDDGDNDDNDVEKCQLNAGIALLRSKLYHPYLVCILFGMPSLHPFTFLMFLKVLFLCFISVTVRPKHKNNISSITTTPKLKTALTI